MERDFIGRLFNTHQSVDLYPSSEEVCDFTTQILKTLFPALASNRIKSFEELEESYDKIKDKLLSILSLLKAKIDMPPEKAVSVFMNKLPEVYAVMLTDIEAIVTGDPAARSEFEVVRSYPGFMAIAMYRIAHELYNLKIPVIPRIITEFAHSRTGIDIHPGAEISSYFCIDHGTGLVIGETTKIGKYVKIYQGVTLGALSVDKSMAQQKRHPTIEDYVIIYSNATILGGNTVIGNNSVIGGNVWVTKSVPAFSTVYHKPQITVLKTNLDSDISV